MKECAGRFDREHRSETPEAVLDRPELVTVGGFERHVPR